MQKRSSQRKGQGGDPSRVLLACIYDTIVVQVTNEMLFELFAKHGSIQKLLVFEKGQVSKAFIQFAKVSDAQKAKKQLDGIKIPGTCCKVHLFFSTLKDVDLSNRMFSRGKDYSSCSSDLIQPEHKLPEQSISSSNVVKTKRKTSDDFDLEHFRGGGSLADVGRYWTDQANHLQAIEMLRLEDPETEEPTHHAIEDSIRKDIQNIIQDENQSKNSYKKCQPLQKPTQLNQPTISVPQMIPVSLSVPQSARLQEQEDPQCNWVLFFSYQNRLRPMQIYNLFSNFGDINKIVVRRNSAIVEFLTPQFAAVARQSLNNLVFYGNVLNLNFCKASLIKEKARQYSQSIVFDQTFYRFSSSKSISINPPSITLHVSNLERDSCQEQRVRQIFEDAGPVDRVSILSNGRSRNMALVKMETLEDSLIAVAMLHGKSIQGRKLQISFTKSRI